VMGTRATRRAGTAGAAAAAAAAAAVAAAADDAAAAEAAAASSDDFEAEEVAGTSRLADSLDARSPSSAPAPAPAAVVGEMGATRLESLEVEAAVVASDFEESCLLLDTAGGSETMVATCADEEVLAAASLAAVSVVGGVAFEPRRPFSLASDSMTFEGAERTSFAAEILRESLGVGDVSRGVLLFGVDEPSSTSKSLASVASVTPSLSFLLLFL